MPFDKFSLIIYYNTITIQQSTITIMKPHYISTACVFFFEAGPHPHLTHQPKQIRKWNVSIRRGTRSSQVIHNGQWARLQPPPPYQRTGSSQRLNCRDIHWLQMRESLNGSDVVFWDAGILCYYKTIIKLYHISCKCSSILVCKITVI